MENNVTSTAYTPGPWFYSKGIDGDFVINGQDTDPFVCSTNPNDERQQANARLIAAAPQLLEALDQLLSETLDLDLAVGNELSDKEQQARMDALTALEKASG